MCVLYVCIVCDCICACVRVCVFVCLCVCVCQPPASSANIWRCHCQDQNCLAGWPCKFPALELLQKKTENGESDTAKEITEYVPVQMRKDNQLLNKIFFGGTFLVWNSHCKKHVHYSIFVCVCVCVCVLCVCVKEGRGKGRKEGRKEVRK